MVYCTKPYSKTEPYDETELGLAPHLKRYKYNVLRWIPMEHWPSIQRLVADDLGAGAKRTIRDCIQRAIDDLGALIQSSLDASPATAGTPYEAGVPLPEAAGYCPTSPALFFPVGVYPAANLVWDPRVPLEGEGMFSTRIQFFQGGQLSMEVDGTKTLAEVLAGKYGAADGWMPEVDAVLHVRPVGGPQSRILGGLADLKLNAAGAYAKAGAQTAPYAAHAIHAREPVAGALLLNGLYLERSSDDLVRFEKGVGDAYLDRGYGTSGGRYVISTCGKGGDYEPWSMTVTRFTIGTGRAKPRTYDPSVGVGPAPAKEPVLDMTKAGNPAAVDAYIDAYHDWIVMDRWGLHPYLYTNDSFRKESFDSAFATTDDEGLLMGRHDYWGAGLLHVVDGAGGSVYLGDARLELKSMLVPPQDFEYGSGAAGRASAAGASPKDIHPKELGPPALVLVENPKHAETSLEIEHIVGFAAVQSGVALVRASGGGIRLTTRGALVSQSSCQLLVDRPEAGGSAAVQQVRSELDSPQYESQYTDPGSGWDRSGRVSSLGRRLEHREAAPDWRVRGRYRAGDIVLNTSVAKGQPVGFVVVAPVGTTTRGFWTMEKMSHACHAPKSAGGGTSWEMADPCQIHRFLPGDRVEVWSAVGNELLAYALVMAVSPRAGRVTVSVLVLASAVLARRHPEFRAFGVLP